MRSFPTQAHPKSPSSAHREAPSSLDHGAFRALFPVKPGVLNPSRFAGGVHELSSSSVDVWPISSLPDMQHFDFNLKISLGSCQRNKPIPSQLQSTKPILSGINQGKSLLPPWQNQSPASTEMCFLWFFFPQQKALQDSGSSRKCGSVTYIGGRA